MKTIETKSLSYYFLNKRLHPPFPKGYRVSIILLIINKNNSENKNRFLIVQETNNIWGLPKEGVKLKITIEDLYTTIARNLELELGFRGIKVLETKPIFRQVGLLFDFDRQDYDTIRSKHEKEKGRPVRGKVYLLSIMEYQGPDKIPFTPNDELKDYQWVDEIEWPKYHVSNIKQVKTGGWSLRSIMFSTHLVNKSVKAYRSIEEIIPLKLGKEDTLF
jgi:hypothetical protein